MKNKPSIHESTSGQLNGAQVWIRNARRFVEERIVRFSNTPPAQRRRTIFLFFLLSIVSTSAVIMISLNRAWKFIPVWKTQPLSDIRHEIGFAYIAQTNHSELSSHEHPSLAQVFEDGKPLQGPANALHDVIRNNGHGGYSFWHDQVYFSASDNSDPATNGRNYAIYRPVIVRMRYTYLAWAIEFLVIGMTYLLIINDREYFVGWVQKYSKFLNPFIWIYKNILPGVLTTAIVLAVIVVAGEVILRMTIPFHVSNWPSAFNPKYGWAFIPGETIRWTNNVDYWTEEKINSLGFIDREPPKSRPENTCRIAFIGDSFVQAAEVQNKDKLPALFEEMANGGKTDINYQTVAFGYSGTGPRNITRQRTVLFHTWE